MKILVKKASYGVSEPTFYNVATPVVPPQPENPNLVEPHDTAGTPRPRGGQILQSKAPKVAVQPKTSKLFPNTKPGNLLHIKTASEFVAELIRRESQ